MPTVTPPQRLLRPLTRVAHELRIASANTRQVSPSRQVELWRRGFYANHALLYDFERYGLDAYVSDVARATRFPGLNLPPHRRVLDDKLLTFLYLAAIGAPTPEVFAFATDGRTELLRSTGGRGVEDLLRERGRLVVKPRGGSGGAHFSLLESDGDRLIVNGSPTDDLQQTLRGDVVVSAFAEQHEYARAIFPHASNTIRVLTMRDAGSDEPFVAFAVHRFGTLRSRPVDNIGQGGMGAAVDVGTGALGPLAAMAGYNFEGPGPARWSDRHPDTDAQVTGVVVPGWVALQAEVCRVMGTLHRCALIGWDVIVTADGFEIIEGNNRPDVHMVQVHRPLLIDPRVREALTARGVVPR
jgi:hypothetical protein